MRLIDADAIPELFDKEYKAIRLLIDQGEEYLDNLAEGFTEAHHVTQKMPTIEAEPVKHGEWKQTTEPLGWDDIDCVECSECKEIWIIAEDFGIDEISQFWHYCPNCGAKMDGERKDNESD